MKTEINLDFGVEEFAVALSLFQKFEEAKGLLLNTYGEISLEEEKGRLLAAYNSLFARGLLMYNRDEAILHSDIKKVLEIFFHSHKLIKTGKSIDSGEDVISYYADKNVWLEHSVVQGLVHRFRYPIDTKVLQNNISKFLSPSTSSSVVPTSIDIPAGLILSAPAGTLNDYDAVLAMLDKNALINSSELKDFSADIANGKWRGSTIWMEHPDQDKLLSRGFLWVQGKDRLWAINSSNSEATSFLKATLCSKESFRLKLQELVSTEFKV